MTERLRQVGEVALYEFLEADGRCRHGATLQAHDGQGSVELLRVDGPRGQHRIIGERRAGENGDAHAAAHELRQGAIGIHGDGVVQPEAGIRRRAVEDPPLVRGRWHGNQRFALEVVEADFLALGEAVAFVEDDMIAGPAQSLDQQIVMRFAECRYAEVHLS